MLTLYLLPPSSDSVSSKEGERTRRLPPFLPFFYMVVAEKLVFSTRQTRDAYSAFALCEARTATRAGVTEPWHFQRGTHHAVLPGILSVITASPVSKHSSCVSVCLSL